ncbi:hypothetical protein FKW77_006398 [Venturia effusa]|uniref:Uncharacterized protein n=1 Tax=Venturia effusa TaxID=50376 RepID=A0A517LN02_9PEZI|nr:hypothetical protein FKW77_006398 [Venturia effusa]
MKAFAIFAVTSFVRGVPIKNQPSELAERDTEFCTHFYEQAYFQGLNTVLCDKQKKCWPGPSFGVSSIKPDSTTCGYCIFYKQPGCAGDNIGIGTENPIEDLAHYGFKNENWNDVIGSYYCDERSDCRVATSAKLNRGEATTVVTSTESSDTGLEVKELQIRGSTELSERDTPDAGASLPTISDLETSTERIGVSLYQETQFQGSAIGLAAKVLACVKISKSDGSGNNFGLSSVRLNTPTTTSGGKTNVAYCAFYTSKDCKQDTWAFTVGNFLEAPDLNDISQLVFKGPEDNVNDKIWSTYCQWNEVMSR